MNEDNHLPNISFWSINTGGVFMFWQQGDCLYFQCLINKDKWTFSHSYISNVTFLTLLTLLFFKRYFEPQPQYISFCQSLTRKLISNSTVKGNFKHAFVTISFCVTEDNIFSRIKKNQVENYFLKLIYSSFLSSYEKLVTVAVYMESLHTVFFTSLVALWKWVFYD